MEDNQNEAILNELKQIRKLLTILAQDKIEVFNEYIENKYLTTDQRKQMYSLFDGTNSLKEIGSQVKTSSEAVRLFAVSLEEAGLLEYEIVNSRQKNPKKLY